MRRRAIVIAAAAVGTGCGFQLRQPARLPFASLALSGFAPGSPIEAEFRRALAASVALRAAPAPADVVLQALSEARERSVVASTAAGQVREIQLRLRFSARATTPDGRVLMAPVALTLARDLSFSESAALAKAEEEASLFREMQVDVVEQIVRRLAAVRL